MSNLDSRENQGLWRRTTGVGETGKSTEQPRVPQTSDPFSLPSISGRMGQVSERLPEHTALPPQILLHPLLIRENGVPLV